MDSTALSLCMENNLPIIVFDLRAPRQHRARASGEKIGTLVTEARSRSSPPARRAAVRWRGRLDHDRRRIRQRRRPDDRRRWRPSAASWPPSAPAAPTPAWWSTCEVDYYGVPTPPRTSSPPSACPSRASSPSSPGTVRLMGAIEKAIQKSDLGLTPTNDGTIIRLSIPPAHRGAAQRAGARWCTRRWRRGASRCATSAATATKHLRRLQREKLISEDDQFRGQEKLQKLTDEYIAAGRPRGRGEGGGAAGGLERAARWNQAPAQQRRNRWRAALRRTNRLPEGRLSCP